MTLNGVCVSVAAALSLGLAWKWRREFAAWKIEERLAAALVPFVLFAAVFLFVRMAFGGDAVRLAPAYALAAKLGLVGPRHPGAALSPQEGPIGAAAYLPALLFRTPGVAAGFLTGLFLLLPLAWAHRSGGAYRAPFTVLAFLLPYVALFCFAGTAELATRVHAIAPAAGFGLFACACLSRRGEEAPPETRAMILSAVFAALSSVCLPVVAPLFLALAAYLGMAWGWRWGGRFLLCFAAAGALVAAIVVPFFGFRALWGTLPPADLCRAGEIFLVQAWPVLAGVVVLGAFRAKQAAAEGARLRRGAWVIPLLAGLFTLPVSLAAGTPPLSLFYFVASLSLLLAGSAGSGGEEPSRRLSRALGVVLASATLAFAAPRVLDLWRG